MILGLFFSYTAISVVIFLIFNAEPPFPDCLKNSLFISFGMLIGLLLLSIYCYVTKNKFKVNYFLCIVYLISWALAISKVIFFTW